MNKPRDMEQQKLARGEGVEPSISWVKAKWLYQFAYPRLAASFGFEPKLPAPETGVLPLDDKAERLYSITLQAELISAIARFPCIFP